MSIDFSVYFRAPAKPPSIEVLHANVVGYLGGATALVRVKEGFRWPCIGVLLAGAPSWAYEPPPYCAEVRGFEVQRHDDCVVILASGQDEYTHAVARGLAAMIKRLHGGHDAPKEDEPSC